MTYTCTSTYTNQIEMSNEKCVPVTRKFIACCATTGLTHLKYT